MQRRTKPSALSPNRPSNVEILSVLEESFVELGVFPPDDSNRVLKRPPNRRGPTDDTASVRDTVFSYAETLRTIKHLFTLRDYNSIFNDPLHPEKLAVYSAEYVAGRALAYADLFSSEESVRNVLGRAKEDTVVVTCLGGGCGSEMVGLTACLMRNAFLSTSQSISTSAEFSAVSESQSSHQGTSKTGLIVHVVDFGDYANILDTLEHSMRSSWGLSRHQIGYSFHKADILDLFRPRMSDSQSQSITTASIITLLFTLNELFRSSKKDTVGLVEGLVHKMRPGALLLCADSSGSFSELEISTTSNKSGGEITASAKQSRKQAHTLGNARTSQTRTATPKDPESSGENPEASGGRVVPVYRLLDLLATPSRSNPRPHFELVYSTDARWFRVEDGVNATERGGKSFRGAYPVKVENMRYWCRILRKV
ncbi:hypothetical protein M427DRAFT_63095, partial [Gonapodya prolifera JEL478]